MEKLDTVNSKCQTKQVICDPVFFQEIPDTNKGTENQCDQIMSCEFVFENFFVFNNTGTSKIGIEKGDFLKRISIKGSKIQSVFSLHKQKKEPIVEEYQAKGKLFLHVFKSK